MRLATVLAAVIVLAGCSGSSTSATDLQNDVQDVPDAVSPGDIPDAAPDIVDPWADATSYEPGVEKRGNVTIVRLKGTAF